MAKAKNHHSKGKSGKRHARLPGMQGIQDQAIKDARESVFRHFNAESSEIVVTGLTESIVHAYDTDDILIPSIKSCPISDFSAEVALNDGSTLKFRFAKEVFAKDSQIRIMSSKKVEPIATIYIEFGEDRMVRILSYDPKGEVGDCTYYVDLNLLTDLEHDVLQRLFEVAYNAVRVVQYHVLTRAKIIKHKIPANTQPHTNTSTATKATDPTAKTHAESQIVLGEKGVTVYTTSTQKMRWTQWWIVGSHYAQRTLRSGETVMVKIRAYTKGPEKNSQEALDSLAAYVANEKANELKVVAR